MRLHRATAATSAVLLGSIALAPAGTATANSAANTASAAACQMTVGSITGGGDIGYSTIKASSPLVAKQGTGPHLFTPGIAKASSTWTTTLDVPAGSTTYGTVVLNDTLYSAYYSDASGVPPTGLKKIGSGWTYFTATEESFWQKTPGSPVIKSARYGLKGGSGDLYRWVGTSRSEVAPGFAAVKAITLISETATYDTFLANTNSGALYTIRIPRTSPLKPIVTKIRTSTWGAFDVLVAERCGTQSTLLTAIDKDTGAAYLYAVGHATGASTVIKGLGKVPGTYKDPVYYLSTAEGESPLYGE